MTHFWKKPGFYVSLIALLCVGFFSFSLYRIGILPVKFMVPIIIIFLILWLIIAILLMRADGGWGSRIIGGILALGLIVSTGFGSYYL